MLFRGFMLIFQSTLRRTERLTQENHSRKGEEFQSTLRRTERLHVISTISALKHFNPRSGERSDCSIPFISSYKKISIHAPANGATCPLGRFIRFAIFQSTLRRTERRFSQSLTIPLINFNPRSGERSDLQLIKEYREFNISIHAPANGATLINMTVSRSGTFQSTLRRTERPIIMITVIN